MQDAMSSKKGVFIRTYYLYFKEILLIFNK